MATTLRDVSVLKRHRYDSVQTLGIVGTVSPLFAPAANLAVASLLPPI